MLLLLSAIHGHVSRNAQANIELTIHLSIEM